MVVEMIFEQQTQAGRLPSACLQRKFGMLTSAREAGCSCNPCKNHPSSASEQP